jgi:hypothetical protein
MMCRQVTNELLQLVEDGILDAETVLTMALNWMSEDDVAEFAHTNELILEDFDEEED